MVVAVWTEARVMTSRHETAYLSAGPEDGTPIVLVHGWPELAISWRHQIPFLADLGFRVIAPDMRGYGGSSTYSTHAAYAQEEVVADMLELVDALHQPVELAPGVPAFLELDGGLRGSQCEHGADSLGEIQGDPPG